MKEEKGNKKLLLLLAMIIPAVVVFIFVVMGGNSSKEDYKPEVLDTEIPIPEVTEKNVESKFQQYINEKEEERKKEYEIEESKISINDVFTGDDINSRSGKENKKEKIEEEPKKTVNTKRSVEVVNKKDNVKEETKEKEVKEDVSNFSNSSMGVVSSGSRMITGNEKKESGENEIKENVTTDDFIQVVLDETVSIKDGTIVVFVCKEDFMYKGKSIEKNSYIYCRANLSLDKCNMESIKAKKTNGEIVALSKFYIYDEKFEKGIPLDYGINESTREALDETVNEENQDIYTGNVLVDGSIKMLDKTISKVSRKKEKSLTLEQGYKIYLKTE